MAILLMEGFDDGLWGERVSGMSSGNVGASYGLHGNGARVGDTPAEEMIVNVPNTEKYYIGFAFKIVASAVANSFVVKFSGASWLRYDSGVLTLHVTGIATADIDWTTSITIGTWYYLEVELEHGATSDGTVTWWKDGGLLDTTSTHDYSIALDSTVLFGGSGTNDVDDMYIDDLVVGDSNGTENTTAVGPVEVTVQLPDGNGNTSGLTGSDGNSTDNHLLVDNNAAAPPATTEYVGSGTEGDKDTYTMGDLSATPTVVAVAVSLYAAKTDTGTKYMRPVVRSGTTDYVGTSVALGETYALVEEVWDQDPDTSATWLYGGVNSMQVGQEVRDS